MVEGDVLYAEEASKDFKRQLIVFYALDVLAELLDHDLLNYRLYHRLKLLLTQTIDLDQQ